MRISKEETIALVVDIQERLFGHIHNAYGIEKSRYTTFANGSMADEQYRLLNKSFVFDL